MIKLLLVYILILFSGLLLAQNPVNDVPVFSQPLDTLPLQEIFQDSLQLAQDTIQIDSVQKPFIEAPIDYNALDSIVFSLDGQKVFLYKNAKVTYQQIVLTADYIELDLDSKEVYAEGLPDSLGVMQGEPIFQDGGDEYESKTLRYNFETQKGIITEVRTQQGEGYIHSKRTKKISAEEFILKDGKYTTCDAEHPHFYLHLTRAKVIKNNKIVTGPAYMVLEDFPLYFPILPFGYFPNSTTYSSGIIIPTYGEEANRGFFLREGGYYWAASDYFDLSLRGDVYSKGSWATKMHTNYKLMYRFSGSFDFSYNVNITGEKGLNTYNRSPQFRVTWSHSQDPKANPSRNFSASVNFSTSGFEKQNSTAYTADNYLQTQKSSSISYSKRWENTPFNMSVNLRHSQNSRDSTISLSLPEMTFAMAKIYPFKRKNRSGKLKWYEKFGINYSTNFRNSIANVREDSLFHTSFSEDWKNGVKHNIPISLPSFNLFDYINFSPSFSYNEKWYLKSYEYSYNKATDKIDVETVTGFNRIFDYSYSINASTNIYGMFTPINKNSKIKGIRHKISPSVSFSYRPDFGKERFGYWIPVADKNGNITYKDRFDKGIFGGSPGRGASGSINLSVNNNIEMKVLDSKDTTKTTPQYKKVKLLDNLSFNASYDLIADSMNLSNINIRGRTTIKGISLNFGGVLDPYMMDSINGRPVRVDKYTWNYNKGLAKLGRLTRANLSFGMSFSSQDLKKKSEGGGNPGNRGGDSGDSEENDEEDVEGAKNTNENFGYVNFDVPWDIRFDYNFNYSRNNPFEKGRITQAVSFSGTLTLTQKWRLSMNSNYDIMAKEFSFTTFTIHRDLHCWQMMFNFVPFGYMKSYSFTLNANSGMLRDLKVDKRRSHYDNF
ncbi:MAG: LPS-assembly protein LptD [Prolixibacteraceae bacterium]|nr:LPS-assembly protein LptD [Prolixibacteraceae bacterium]